MTDSMNITTSQDVLLDLRDSTQVIKAVEEIAKERDALRAELAKLKQQEPVAWMLASALDDFKRGYIVEVSSEQEEPDDLPLFLAAGASQL